VKTGALQGARRALFRRPGGTPGEGPNWRRHTSGDIGRRLAAQIGCARGAGLWTMVEGRCARWLCRQIVASRRVPLTATRFWRAPRALAGRSVGWAPLLGKAGGGGGWAASFARGGHPRKRSAHATCPRRGPRVIHRCMQTRRPCHCAAQPAQRKFWAVAGRELRAAEIPAGKLLHVAKLGIGLPRTKGWWPGFAQRLHA